MNVRKILNYFEIAGRTARSKDDRRQFLHGAVGIRADGVMVRALNGPTRQPTPQAHAEARLARKLDHGATVVVARVSCGTGQFANSRPCDNCISFMKSRRVKRVYFSTGPQEYDFMDLC